MAFYATALAVVGCAVEITRTEAK